jgi:hypothetical protein
MVKPSKGRCLALAQDSALSWFLVGWLVSLLDHTLFWAGAASVEHSILAWASTWRVFSSKDRSSSRRGVRPNTANAILDVLNENLVTVLYRMASWTFRLWMVLAIILSRSLKGIVYRNNPHTADEMKVSSVVVKITADILSRAVASLQRWLQIVLDADGSLTEHVFQIRITVIASCCAS